MSAANTDTTVTRVRHPWALVFVLGLALCLNFFDRGNLAVAAPILAPEFGLSQWQLGILLSAFFWTYAVSLIGAGWLVDRLEVRWLYAAGVLVWAVATFSTAAVTSFSAL